MAKQSIDPFRKVKSPFKPGQSVGTPTQVAGGGGGLKYVDPKVAIARAAENQAKRDAATGGGATTFKDPVTGRVTGVTSKGKTYLDLDPQEAEKLIEQEDFEAFAGSSGSTGAKGMSIVEANRLKAIEKEQGRITEEELPERGDLSPEFREGETAPVIGAEIAIIQNLLEDSARNGLLGDIGVKAQKEGWLQPEVYKSLARTEIERKVYEEGITASEKFGAFVESIPVLGFIAKYTGGLVEDPYSNIQEMRKNIRKEKVRATNAMTLARTGEINPEIALETISDVEQEIWRLQSRIKLLANYSGQLRFNSDQINTIETEILAIQEVLLEAKLRAAEGAIQDPDELQYFKTLSTMNQGVEDLE